MRTRAFVWLLAIVVFAAACSNADDAAVPKPAAPAATESPATTSSPGANGDAIDEPAPDVATDPATTPTTAAVLDPSSLPEPLECDDAEGDFGVWCEAIEVIADRYVDELPPEVLAAAASRGIDEFESAGPSTGITACALPSDEYETFCAEATAETAEAAAANVVESALRGVIQFALEDPNSAFLDPQAVQRVQEDQSGEVEGIGALVRTEDPTAPGESSACTVLGPECEMVIVSVLDGSPAEAAGVKPGDVTLTVNGESVAGWSLDEVVAEVRGPAGTDVRIGFDRDGEAVDLTITRASLTVPVVQYELLANDVGYVQLLIFSNNSAGQVRDALTDLIDQGATSIVLDLQDNPGGALNAAVDIASEFLDGGLVLRTEGRDDEFEYEVQDGGVAVDESLRLVVLMNGGSASASEVVSGVLQERGRATILGTNSFGKNTVQQQYSLSGGSAIKVTTARWLTPKGADFGTVGITPDVFIEPADSDTLLEAALDLLNA